jgi:hypothetical protein
MADTVIVTNTLYDDIFTDFMTSKLVNDKEYTNYVGITDETEIASLIQSHNLILMNDAITEIYKNGSPQIDLTDQDSVNCWFNNVLTAVEQNLIVDGMYYFYMCETRNKTKLIGLTFTSVELNLFSPAADRDSYEKMLKSLGDDFFDDITSYLIRDRLTHRILASQFGNC